MSAPKEVGVMPARKATKTPIASNMSLPAKL